MQHTTCFRASKNTNIGQCKLGQSASNVNKNHLVKERDEMSLQTVINQAVCEK